VEDVIRRGRAWLAWLLPSVWACGLLILSAQPAERLPAVPVWQLDKLVHALLYAVLGALTGRALAVRAPGDKVARVALALAAVGLAGFGLFDEWTQSFTPGRMSSAADAVADAIGAVAGLCAASRYDGRRHALHAQLRRQAPGHRR
jgi:VanZ family protein